eukprot:Rhum_TRINITY_DN25304_c0_g1::Rhum_TRINITY_DN25304_c0_g1_i1::g.181810::m.181810
MRWRVDSDWAGGARRHGAASHLPPGGGGKGVAGRGKIEQWFKGKGRGGVGGKEEATAASANLYGGINPSRLKVVLVVTGGDGALGTLSGHPAARVVRLPVVLRTPGVAGAVHGGGRALSVRTRDGAGPPGAVADGEDRCVQHGPQVRDDRRVLRRDVRALRDVGAHVEQAGTAAGRGGEERGAGGQVLRHARVLRRVGRLLPGAVGLLPAVVLRLEVRLGHQQLILPRDDHLLRDEQVLVRGADVVRRAVEQHVPDVRAVDGREGVVPVDVLEGLCRVRRQGSHGRVVVAADAGQVREGRVPVHDVRVDVVRRAAEGRRHDAAGDEGRDADAALPVRVLLSTEGVVVAVLGAAVVGAVDDQRVVVHLLLLERGDELAHLHVGRPQHALERRRKRVVRHRVVRGVHCLEGKVQEERGGRVVVAHGVDCEVAVEVARVLRGVDALRVVRDLAVGVHRVQVLPPLVRGVRLGSGEEAEEVVESLVVGKVVHGLVAGVPLAVPVRGVAGLLQLLREKRPAQVEVVGVDATELLAVVQGQAARQEGAARGRAVPVRVVVREDDAVGRQARDVLRVRLLGGGVEADVVVAQVVLQDHDDVRLRGGVGGDGAAGERGCAQNGATHSCFFFCKVRLVERRSPYIPSSFFLVIFCLNEVQIL